MATVEQILLEKGSELISASPMMTVAQACRKMKEANVGSVIIEVDGTTLGIFTERDLLARVVAADRNPGTTRLCEVMTAPVLVCEPQDDMDECAEKFASEHIRHLVVQDKGEAVGMISLRDALGAQLAECPPLRRPARRRKAV